MITLTEEVKRFGKLKYRIIFRRIKNNYTYT